MRFVGIDIAAEQHTVAVVDESGAVLLRATPVTEDSIGYGKLLELQTAACIDGRDRQPGALSQPRRVGQLCRRYSPAA